MRGISNHRVKVSLWGVGAHILRTLLWGMIGANSVVLLLMTWTSLTVSALVPWSVGVMLVIGGLMVVSENADRAATA